MDNGATGDEEEGRGVSMHALPVVRQQSILKDEPPPLVALEVVRPLEEPSLFAEATRCDGRRGSLARGDLGRGHPRGLRVLVNENNRTMVNALSTALNLRRR